MRNGDVAALVAIASGALVSTALSVALAAPLVQPHLAEATSTASAAAMGSHAVPPVRYARVSRRTVDFAVIRIEGPRRIHRSEPFLWTGPGADRFIWDERRLRPHGDLPGHDP